MSTAYALLLGLVIFLVLFIYFVFFCFSKIEKNENEAEIVVKRKSVPFKWKDLVDPKNKKWVL